eukprot:g67823.t1
MTGFDLENNVLFKGGPLKLNTAKSIKLTRVAMLFSLLLCLLLRAVDSHAVISWPLPRYNKDDKLKQYPCGAGDDNQASPLTPVTALRPGRTLLKFRETVNHAGAPYRVALSVGGQTRFEEHVLLDHVPHNDQGSTSEQGDSRADPNYGKMHAIEVEMPDLNCTREARCVLQLVQIMTDKMGPAGCAPADLPNSCGSPSFAYFSCADVTIDGAADPAKWAPSYVSYTGNSEPSNWLPGESSDWLRQASGVWHLPSLTRPWPSVLAPLSAAFQDMLLRQALPAPRPDSLEQYLLGLSSTPHVAGTAQQRNTAQYVSQAWEQQGLSVQQLSFDGLLDYPVSAAVALLPDDAANITAYTCQINEPVLPEDSFTSSENVLSPFVGYAPSGNVTGQLLYVNYARREDFLLLQDLGVSCSGRVAIARYGKGHRGVKAMLAQQFGCSALLLYSDPADDGFTVGRPYPDGPGRPKWGVQRGSGLFSNICPGDPRRTATCLGEGATSYEGTLTPAIPVQPLSWGDAEPLLRALSSPDLALPAGWQGALSFSYQIGPGPAVVSLQIAKRRTVSTMVNVVGRFPGQGPLAQEIVLIGHHRDAWVHGANDNGSGGAVLLELARVMGQLRAAGWAPLRTIQLCSWDGEEYGLAGSVNYVEQHAQYLRERAVAYINIDSASFGSDFTVQGAPSLLPFLLQLADLVSHPFLPARKVGEAWTEAQYAMPGAGSDYAAFFHHLGVPVLDFGFNGLNGVYHSLYDTPRFVGEIADPGFKGHTAITQLSLALVLTLAELPVLPFSYQNTAVRLAAALDQLTTGYAQQSQLQLTALQEALLAFQEEGRRTDAGIAATLSQSLSQAAALNQELIRANAALRQTEMALLSEQGNPGRPWYKHQLIAPGKWKGYGADAFPALAEALYEQDDSTANSAAESLARTVQQATQALSVAFSPPPAAAATSRAPGWGWLVIGLLLLLLGTSLLALWDRRRRRRVTQGMSTEGLDLGTRARGSSQDSRDVEGVAPGNYATLR